MNDRLEGLWVSYRAVLPPDAGPVQVMETKRAFFAGAASLLTALTDFEQQEPSEAEFLGRLASISAEVAAFGRSGGRI